MATNALVRIDGLFRRFERDEINALALSILYNKEMADARSDAIKDPRPTMLPGVRCDRCRCEGHTTETCEDSRTQKMLLRSTIEAGQEILRRYPLVYLEPHFMILRQGLVRHPNDPVLKELYGNLKKEIDEIDDVMWNKKISEANHELIRASDFVEQCKGNLISAEKTVIDVRHALHKLKDENGRRLEKREEDVL